MVNTLRAWIEVSAARRRWRVGIRNSYRWVAVIVGLTAIFTSHPNVNHIDASREIFDGLSVQLFGLTTWTLPSLSMPEWLIQIVLMLGALAISFFVTGKGFKLWEWYEQQQFFNKEGYRLAKISIAVVCFGWVALIASIPIVTVLGGHQAALQFDTLWPTLAGSVASFFILWRSYRAPGTHERWALQLLRIGEELLAKTNANRDDFNEALIAFELSKSILERSHHKEYRRAASGLAEARAQLANYDEAVSCDTTVTSGS